MVKDKGYRLLSVFLLALLLFNFPLIRLFSGQKLLYGFPSLYLYIFGAWLLVILLTIRIVEASGKDSQR